MSYLFSPDTGRLAVEIGSDGTLRALHLLGRRHPVATVLNRWRIDERWWTEHQQRDYFKVMTQTGWLVVIYHNLVDDGWYLERVHD